MTNQKTDIQAVGDFSSSSKSDWGEHNHSKRTIRTATAHPWAWCTSKGYNTLAISDWLSLVHARVSSLARWDAADSGGSGASRRHRTHLPRRLVRRAPGAARWRDDDVCQKIYRRFITMRQARGLVDTALIRVLVAASATAAAALRRCCNQDMPGVIERAKTVHGLCSANVKTSSSSSSSLFV